MVLHIPYILKKMTYTLRQLTLMQSPYIHHVDLKSEEVVSSKKLELDDEEYSKSGLPGNPALVFYKGYLYYAVNQVRTGADDHTVINAGKLVKIDPKTLEIVKKYRLVIKISTRTRLQLSIINL